MNWDRFLESSYKWICRILGNDVYVDLRLKTLNGQGFLLSLIRRMVKVIRAGHATSAVVPEFTKDEKIVVVGAGVAGIAAIKELHNRGYKNITLVEYRQRYGARCVHQACMPSEYFYAHLPHPDGQSMRSMIRGLSQSIKNDLENRGVTVYCDRALSVELNSLICETANLHFDRLILATGRPQSKIIKSSAVAMNQISLDEFWQLDSGRLLIVGVSNLTLLTLADVARIKGLSVTLLYSGQIMLHTLPAVRYFISMLKSKGINIVELTRIRMQGGKLSYQSNSTWLEIEYDHLYLDTNYDSIFIDVDKRSYSQEHINYADLSLAHRDNVYVLGDASGMLGAAEAESQAALLVDSWVTGKPLESEYLYQLPIRLHAEKPLAMVGKPWTYHSDNWRRLTFNNMGYSKVSCTDGYAWYNYNERTAKVEAIHLYHDLSAELIAQAQLLLDYTIYHPAWVCGAIHPSAMEIFKLIRDDAIRKQAVQQRNVLYKQIATRIHQECKVIEYSAPLGNSPLFSQEEHIFAQLSESCELHYQLLFSIKTHYSQDQHHTVLIQFKDKHHCTLADGSEVYYRMSGYPGVIFVNIEGQSYLVTKRIKVAA